MFYGNKFNEYSLKMMRFCAIFTKDYTYFIALFSFYYPYHPIMIEQLTKLY